MKVSKMTTHPYDIMTLPDKGYLIFTPCPGTTGIDITTSISDLQQAGADAIITMMADDELEKLGVPSLPDIVRQNAMIWFQFPVEDDAAPAESFEQSWYKHKLEVLSLLSDGKCVAIHCRGGTGRTGLMAALIMCEMGIDEERTTTLVKGLRPESLKLSVHTEYLAKYYESKTC